MTIEQDLLALTEKVEDLRWTKEYQWTTPNSKFFAACDPDTIAKLCKVVEAARLCVPEAGTFYTHEELRTALRALDGEADAE